MLLLLRVVLVFMRLSTVQSDGIRGKHHARGVEIQTPSTLEDNLLDNFDQGVLYHQQLPDVNTTSVDRGLPYVKSAILLPPIVQYRGLVHR